MDKDDFSDIECECCGSDIPIKDQEALELVWLSTMAFVAAGVIDEDDADSGVTYCSWCADRVIGPVWHALGKAKASEYRWWCQLQNMLDGQPDYSTKH